MVLQFIWGKSVAQIKSCVPFSIRTIYRWISRFLLGGMESLQDRKRTGRPRPGTDRHLAWIRIVVLDQDPNQYQFECAGWTAQRVRRILRRLGLPPQRPQRRATRCDPAAVQRWKDEEFPQVLRRAQELGALIACADESGLAAQSVSGRTGGPCGQTPVGRVASGRFRLLAASSPEGQLYYTVREGPVTAEVFREFLKRIAKEAERKILLVVDHGRIHRARTIREWLEENQAAIELYFQPPYSPQVNPVERLGALVQRRVRRELSKTEAKLRDNLEAACQSLQKALEQMHAFLRKADCKSILACILRTRLLTRSGPVGDRGCSPAPASARRSNWPGWTGAVPRPRAHRARPHCRRNSCEPPLRHPGRVRPRPSRDPRWPRRRECQPLSALD